MSRAVRAAYGWSLGELVRIDRQWVSDQLDVLLDDLATDLQLATWIAFLHRYRGSATFYAVLGPVYARYAMQLSALDGPPVGDGFALHDPPKRFCRHLLELWLWDSTDVSAPIRTILGSGRKWLIEDFVEEAGRLVTGAATISPEIAESLHELWRLIRELAAGDALHALGGFAWWFDSPLDTAWTLPELVDLLEHGVDLDVVHMPARRGSR